MKEVERRVKPQNLHFNPPLPLPPPCDWYKRSRLRTSDPHPLPASAVLEAAPSYRMQQLHFVLSYQLIQDAHHINSLKTKNFFLWKGSLIDPVWKWNMLIDHRPRHRIDWHLSTTMCLNAVQVEGKRRPKKIFMWKNETDTMEMLRKQRPKITTISFVS